jgi:hypothetical protein
MGGDDSSSEVIDDEIAVERNEAQLIAFAWRGRRYAITSVQVVGTLPTRWWEGQGERTYVRVSARGHVYELYFDHERQAWILARQLS